MGNNIITSTKNPPNQQLRGHLECLRGAEIVKTVIYYCPQKMKFAHCSNIYACMYVCMHVCMISTLVVGRIFLYLGQKATKAGSTGKSIFGPSILLDVQGYVIKKENEIPLFLFFIKILSTENLF